MAAQAATNISTAKPPAAAQAASIGIEKSAASSIAAQTATSKSSAKSSASGKVGKRIRKRAKRTVLVGKVFIKASFNNTIITITDEQGNKIIQNSAGQEGFKGSRKSTPFAAQTAAEKAGMLARDDFGMKAIEIRIAGAGPGRESAIRALISLLGMKLIGLVDITRIPHNGVRAPKKRRV